jgi:SAM-dependent methyltransferase
MRPAVVWHEVECGGYGADLAVWEELAERATPPVLELGAGSGRVALHLARRGREVWALDADPALLETLAAHAAAEGLEVRTECADMRALSLDRRFGLILAPMQVLQMIGGPGARRAALERSAAHLAPGGLLAAAVVEPGATTPGVPAAALPDVREVDGWVYSSLPVAVATAEGCVEIRRLRQSVSPDGALSEEEHRDRLDALDVGALEAEGARAGLSVAWRLEVQPGDGHVGSTVVVLRRA